MLRSLVGSTMNMTADLLIQQNSQSPSSGVILREWVYDKTVQCRIDPLKSSGASERADSKKFNVGRNHEYTEKLELTMKCLIPLSKRWRITNIKSNDGSVVYTEIDRQDNPGTIFEVVSSHAVLDPFGKVSYYEVTIERVRVQDDNTSNQ